MTVTTSVTTCDQCGKRLGEDYGGWFQLEGKVLNPPGEFLCGAPLDRNAHFCNVKCLRLWASEKSPKEKPPKCAEPATYFIPTGTCFVNSGGSWTYELDSDGRIVSGRCNTQWRS